MGRDNRIEKRVISRSFVRSPPTEIHQSKVRSKLKIKTETKKREEEEKDRKV